MQNNEQLNFQIKTIELLDIELTTGNLVIPSTVEYKFEINLEHRVNIESSLLVVICNIEIYTENKENRHARIRTSCIYEIQELAEKMNPKTKKIDLPDSIIVSLNSISLSTTRGIMFDQFKGTYLHGAILPIIDPKQFLNQPSN